MTTVIGNEHLAGLVRFRRDEPFITYFCDDGMTSMILDKIVNTSRRSILQGISTWSTKVSELVCRKTSRRHVPTKHWTREWSYADMADERNGHRANKFGT